MDREGRKDRKISRWRKVQLEGTRVCSSISEILHPVHMDYSYMHVTEYHMVLRPVFYMEGSVTC